MVVFSKVNNYRVLPAAGDSSIHRFFVDGAEKLLLRFPHFCPPWME
jgi:hypothetical protein